jgi:hypothetical protein
VLIGMENVGAMGVQELGDSRNDPLPVGAINE